MRSSASPPSALCASLGSLPRFLPRAGTHFLSGFLSGSAERSRWSLWSQGSFLSIGSRGSVLSIGSVGSFASIGGVGSALSVFSIGSWLSAGSVLSSMSRWSVLSHQSRRGVLTACNADLSRSFGRARRPGVPGRS